MRERVDDRADIGNEDDIVIVSAPVSRSTVRSTP